MKIMLIAVVILVMTIAVNAQTETDEKQVRQAVQSFYDAFNSHDFDSSAEYTTHDWTHIIR